MISDHYLLIQELKLNAKIEKLLGSNRYYPKKEISEFARKNLKIDFSLRIDYGSIIRQNVKPNIFTERI